MNKRKEKQGEISISPPPTLITSRDGVGGITALAAAASFGRTGCARVLLARGADVFVPATDGRAPVFLASSGGHLATLRLLLDAAGADREMEIARPDSEGRTPVMAASANGHLGCLRALLGEDGGGGGGPEENGAEERQGCVPGIDAPDGQGRTALMHACMFDQVGDTAPWELLRQPGSV